MEKYSGPLTWPRCPAKRRSFKNTTAAGKSSQLTSRELWLLHAPVRIEADAKLTTGTRLACWRRQRSFPRVRHRRQDPTEISLRGLVMTVHTTASEIL